MFGQHDTDAIGKKTIIGRLAAAVFFSDLLQSKVTLLGDECLYSMKI